MLRTCQVFVRRFGYFYRFSLCRARRPRLGHAGNDLPVPSGTYAAEGGVLPVSGERQPEKKGGKFQRAGGTLFCGGHFAVYQTEDPAEEILKGDLLGRGKRENAGKFPGFHAWEAGKTRRPAHREILAGRHRRGSRHADHPRGNKRLRQKE